MKIFVITLSDALARQQQSARRLRELGLDFTFFPAVAGHEAIRSQSCNIAEREFLLSTGRKPTAGEVGCFASHRLLWKLCAQIGEPVLIMEDDFLLADGFVDAVSHVEREIGEFGFIRLQSEQQAKKQPIKTLDRFTLWRYAKAPNSSMCYGLSPDAATRLLESADTINAPVDVFMKRFWRHGQRMFGLTPYTVSESELSRGTQISGRFKARKDVATRIARTWTRIAEVLARHQFNRRTG
jgi:glycosyl transferase family 25